MTRHHWAALSLSLLLLLHLLTLAHGECTCDEESLDRDKTAALRYRIGAIVSILVAGAVGIVIPMLGKVIPALRPERDIFFVVKAFAAGVILATAFIHVFPEAYERLTSPCLKGEVWGNFPFAGFVTMVAAIMTLQIDTLATSYYTRRHFHGDEAPRVVAAADNKEDQEAGGSGADHAEHLHLHTHANQGHAHPPGPSGSGASSDLLRHRVISQVLEVGIVAHSVIIGIALGASESPKTIRPLMGALTFHQFFEGVGLGSCIMQARFKTSTALVMALFFSLTTPVGIAIGIGISNTYNDSSPTALIIEGILDAASSGILIYMALVDLCAADFMNPRMQGNGRLQLWSNASLLLGAGLMSVLAKWA
ncbi:hypothetical protein SAY86_029284 [Trapa natans]|uniref:Uncharacterized protein n=1 Tax=Trapa natans TaxID=22666 RepID=A0AAN7MKZ9_TRANT|nr:hypothetical protein SAY86_029284 [Trapa natans]